MKYVMKAVNALIAAAIFPVAIFLDFIFIQIGTNENAQWLVQMINPDSGGVGIEEYFSIYDFIQIARGKHTYSYIFKDLMAGAGDFTWPEALAPINARLITFAVCFFLCLLIAIFVIVFSICSSKRLPVLIAGVGGLISAITMICCFNSAAGVLTRGEISIVSLLSGADSGWIMDLLMGFIGIDTLMLGGFHSGFVIVFICIIVWTGAFAVIDLGETKEEKIKKAKH